MVFCVYAQRTVLNKGKDTAANLHRLRATPDGHGAPVVRQRAYGDRLGCNRLRLRCHEDRPVPFGLSVGTVSRAQGGYQTSHTLGPARLLTHFHSPQRRQDKRSQHLGLAGHRDWRLLPARSWVPGFPTTLGDSSGQRLLRHPCQVQYQVQAALLQPREPGQLEHRVRPERCADHLLFQPRLSCHAETCGHQGRDGQTNNFFGQQFCLQAQVDCRPVPPALACRIFLNG